MNKSFICYTFLMCSLFSCAPKYETFYYPNIETKNIEISKIIEISDDIKSKDQESENNTYYYLGKIKDKFLFSSDYRLRGWNQTYGYFISGYLFDHDYYLFDSLEDMSFEQDYSSRIQLKDYYCDSHLNNDDIEDIFYLTISRLIEYRKEGQTEEEWISNYNNIINDASNKMTTDNSFRQGNFINDLKYADYEIDKKELISSEYPTNIYLGTYNDYMIFTSKESERDPKYNYDYDPGIMSTSFNHRFYFNEYDRNEFYAYKNNQVYKVLDLYNDKELDDFAIENMSYAIYSYLYDNTEMNKDEFKSNYLDNYNKNYRKGRSVTLNLSLIFND